MNIKNINPGPFDGSLRDNLLAPTDFGGILMGALTKVFRHWLLLVGFIVASLVLALLYLANATPQYSASGAILIDPLVGVNADTPAAATPALLSSDALTVDSEIQVLMSREVTASAARVLGLGAETEEVAEEPGALQRLMEWFRPQADVETAEDVLADDVQTERDFEAVRKKFAEKLSVERTEDTFVIALEYTSPDLEFAPEAVNTVMQEYLRISAERNLKNTENTRNWLASRLDEVANEVEAAEQAVAEYRWANSLLAPEGELLSLTSLVAANQDLILVQNEMLALKVSVEQMSSQIDSGRLDAIDIPAEDRGRTALVEYEGLLAEQLFKEQELLLRYDSNSEVLENNRIIQDRTRNLILTEFGKVRDRMVTQLRTLELRADETRARIDALTDEYGSDLAKLVELRHLERVATAKRQLYERLSNEFDQATQLLTYDIVDAQVIAWAVVPSDKSSPKSMQVLVLSVFAALVLGLSTIFLIEDLDSRFRTPSDVRDELGLDLIGLIPKFGSDIKKKGGAVVPSIPKPKLLGKWRGLPKNTHFAVDYPASITAQTLRALHVELSFGKNERHPEKRQTVVGFTSSVRAEGKTTTALNFATFLAARGESVVLLDLDFLAFNMSRQLRPALAHENKLMELIAGPAEVAPSLEPVPAFPNLYFVGAVSQQPVGAPTPRELEALNRVIEVLREQFDMVIVDLPPLRGVSESQLLANLCDKVVFLIDWTKTPKGVAASALRHWKRPKGKIIGALFTKARLRNYESFNKNEIHDYYG